MNERELILNIISGNSALYKQLVVKYQQLVFSVIIKMVKNSSDAEELTQDVFVKAYCSLSSFSGSAKFSTWIYRIAYNATITYLKKVRKHVSYDSDLAKNIDIADDDNALSEMEYDDKMNRLKIILNKLPAEESAIIQFYYYQEMPVDEVASVTGLSESNVKVKLHRIRQKMKLELQTNFGICNNFS